MSDTLASSLNGPATQALSDEALEQVTGGVASPRDPASGQASGYFALQLDGVACGVAAEKKKNTGTQSVRAVGELLENQ